MLRSLVIALGVLCILGGAAAVATGRVAQRLRAVIFGALLLLGTILGAAALKPVERGSPGPGWAATDERFIDDDNGQWCASGSSPRAGSGVISATDSSSPVLTGDVPSVQRRVATAYARGGRVSPLRRFAPPPP